MKNLTITLFLLHILTASAQDVNLDYSKIHENSKSLEHLLELFTIHGVPQNQHVDDTLLILINHGYVSGFSKKYNQPLWTAYQVSRSREDVDYERFPFFVDDARLEPENQIGTKTFGRGYDLGHLAPNATINRQYGKLAQMETFLMSNISPQKANLNRGVWYQLENEILNTYPYANDDDGDKYHVWVIVGPVFGSDPKNLRRGKGVKIAIPDAFYCILVRPFRYDYGAPTNSNYKAFLFPQEIERSQPIDISFIKSINDIEEATGLNFFPDFSNRQERRIEPTILNELW